MTQDFGTPVTPINEVPPPPAAMPPAQPPKSNSRTIWIIVAVVVVLLCCCCVIAAGVFVYNSYNANPNFFNNIFNGGGLLLPPI